MAEIGDEAQRTIQSDELLPDEEQLNEVNDVYINSNSKLDRYT
jgi:hypothetical protein